MRISPAAAARPVAARKQTDQACDQRRQPETALQNRRSHRRRRCSSIWRGAATLPLLEAGTAALICASLKLSDYIGQHCAWHPRVPPSAGPNLPEISDNSSSCVVLAISSLLPALRPFQDPARYVVIPLLAMDFSVAVVRWHHSAAKFACQRLLQNQKRLNLPRAQIPRKLDPPNRRRTRKSSTMPSALRRDVRFRAGPAATVPRPHRTGLAVRPAIRATRIAAALPGRLPACVALPTGLVGKLKMEGDY